jgi:cytoplasmic iron level regulating protein YaaA (DUF328/UPF0246 family)
MKILLAPSETKRPGGDKPFDPSWLHFGELEPIRLRLIERYRALLAQGDHAVLAKLFGLKQPKAIAHHATHTILGAPTLPAIERYTGVAFDHLDYPTLSADAQAYLHRNLILHSNLFGFLRANDRIPEYRLKQGEPIGDLYPEKLYREHGAPLVEAWIGDEDLLDLRATFYERIYKPTRPYTVLKFLKANKVVSHWAKAYRGLVLRAIAKAQVGTLEDFMRLPIEGLHLHEIHRRKNRTEILYAILA